MKIGARWLALALLFVGIASLTACGCDHKEVIDVAVPATCTQAGLTAGKHCALCNDVLVAQNAVPALGHTEEIIKGFAASCTTAGTTDGKKCSVCGKILIEQQEITALGHTTQSGTCSRCNVSLGLFTSDYYVDEFNEPTSIGYVTNKSYIIGKFSNSATTDSSLYVQVLADKEDITFFLYEYGRNLVKNSSSRYVEEYDITMKTANGTKYHMTGRILSGGDRLFIDVEYVNMVLNALKSGETISFYIIQSDRTTTTYLFSVNTSNFAEEYTKMFG